MRIPTRVARCDLHGVRQHGVRLAGGTLPGSCHQGGTGSGCLVTKPRTAESWPVLLWHVHACPYQTVAVLSFAPHLRQLNLLQWQDGGHPFGQCCLTGIVLFVQASGPVKLATRVTMKPALASSHAQVCQYLFLLAQPCTPILSMQCDYQGNVPVLGCEGSYSSCLHQRTMS